jgi:very-short-patch-repair endonuclease
MTHCKDNSVPYRGEVLVAIINNKADFALAMDQHWYRVPVSSQQKWLKDRWPPKWLAFYQTKKLGLEAYAIHYFAKVNHVQLADGRQLFPNQSRGEEKDSNFYHQLLLEPLQPLPRPILSRRRRTRIVFIPTTWEKFARAEELNDLYSESSLEEQLWDALKELGIRPERQELVTVKDRDYFLDFAIYCARGKIDVETDGDHWHANPEKAELDNVRDNDLESAGWQQLRFAERQIKEQTVEYCIPKIVKTINNLGGLEEGRYMPRKIDPHAPTGIYQPSLFDDT